MNRHFYTVPSARPGNPYNYFGDIGHVYETEQPNTKALYRRIADNEGLHFFTLDELEGIPPYHPDGNGVCCYVPDGSLPGVVPIYRFWNPSTGDHFFSRRGAAREDHIEEGVRFYLFDQPQPGTVPLEIYNANENDGETYCLKIVFQGRLLQYVTIRARGDLDNQVAVQMHKWTGSLNQSEVGSELSQGACPTGYGHPADG